MIDIHRACSRFFFLFFISGWLGTSAATASELHDAVKADDAGRVRAAIAAGADISENDVYMGSPLHIAAARGSVEITKLLLDAGADIEALGVGSLKKAHPLHIAARVNGVAIATLLVKRGAKVDSRDAQDRTPLFVAASSGQAEVADFLLQAGADPLAEESDYHDTAIYIAAMNGNLGVVKLMVSKGVSANIRNTHTGETPLWVAAMDNHLKVMEFLLTSGADPNTANLKGETPLKVSVSPEAKDLLRKFGAKE
jgi:ankyrin repeat protein